NVSSAGDGYAVGPGDLALAYNHAGNLQAGHLGGLQPVGDPSWQIVDARFVSDKALMLLRNVGWTTGPQTVQLYNVNLGSPAVVQGIPGVVPDAKLSPSGRFAVGLVRSGTISQLVILSLQTGQKVRIVGADDVSSVLWIS